MDDYTAADKLKEVKRELYMRSKVYPDQIAKNALTQKAAKKQIGIMEAIAADYQRLIDREKLPLEGSA
jgi:hypothetical protein